MASRILHLKSPRRLSSRWAAAGARILIFIAVCLRPAVAQPASSSPAHWAFQPVQSPALPPVRDAGWPKTGVDLFILASLENAGLNPAPPADRRALIRRATFDLTGLPPTPEAVRNFLTDPDPAAFAKVVERLLASPHYGERWGRHWLDVARYADSNGMDENLAYASAWRYRDYVVRAFNQDKPYDQFIREQLAGDLIPAASQTQHSFDPLIATGFLTIGPKMLAEDDPVKMEMDIIDEQVDTLSRAFIGLTVGCARCHDHKYDPVSMTDYYALAGIFKSTRTMEHFRVVARWQETPLASAAEIAEVAAHRQRIDAQKQQISALIDQGNAPLLEQARNLAAAYWFAATGSETNASLPSEIQSPPAPLLPEFITQWSDYIKKARADTNSILHPWHDYQSRTLGSGSTNSAPLSALQPAFLRPLFDPPPSNLEELNKRYAQTFEQAERAWREQTSSKPTSGSQTNALSDPLLEAFRRVLHDPKGPFAPPKTLETQFSPDRLAGLKNARETLQHLEQTLRRLPEAMTVSDGAIQDLRIHKRGSHLALGDQTARGFPLSVGAPPPSALATNQSGRLQLADWLTDPAHPLTARVLVNRLWVWHFGDGLVRTPDNFGILGEKPTHPALLDWLARQFMQSGWSIKSMHRLIMNSAVYQQASALASPALSDPTLPAAALDPENRLWSRYSRRRLEVEAIRDSILFVSGRLNLNPPGSLLTIENRAYVASTANHIDVSLFDRPARSLYLPVVRSALYDVFQVFDFADPSVLNGRRDQTTVAPQALFMLNSQLVADAARQIAAALLRDPLLADAARLDQLYMLAYGRNPSPEETARGRRYLERYQQTLTAAQTHQDPASTPLLAWQSLSRAVLAASEFIYIE